MISFKIHPESIDDLGDFNPDNWNVVQFDEIEGETFVSIGDEKCSITLVADSKDVAGYVELTVHTSCFDPCDDEPYSFIASVGDLSNPEHEEDILSQIWIHIAAFVNSLKVAA